VARAAAERALDLPIDDDLVRLSAA
jgi:hypothetical protein